jgi:hypothetical protein
MTRDKVVDWLLQNTTLTLNTIKFIDNTAFVMADNPFSDEIKDQKIQLVKTILLNEAAKTIGLTIVEFHEIISDEEFKKYIEEVIKNG